MKYSVALTFAMLALMKLSFGDVKGINDSINFDVNFDGSKEMSLSTNGLLLGSTEKAQSNLHVMGNALVTQGLSVGSSGSFHSNLQISGSFSQSIQSVSTNTYLSNQSLVMANSSSGNLTLSLPSVQGIQGRIYQVKKTVSASDVWVIGGDNIDGMDMIQMASSNTLPWLKVLAGSDRYHLLESSGALGTSFSSDGNLIAWFDSNSSASVTRNASNVVSIWFSRSSNGGNATVVSGDTFTYTANLINNRPALRTTGSSSDRMSFSGTGNCFSVFLVGQSTSANAISKAFPPSNGGVFFTEHGTTSISLGSSTAHVTDEIISLNYGGGTNRISYAHSSNTINGPFLICMNYNPVSQRYDLYLNSRLVSNTFRDTIPILGFPNPALGGAGYPFDYAEFMVYNKVLSLTERMNIESYLMQKWAISP